MVIVILTYLMLLVFATGTVFIIYDSFKTEGVVMGLVVTVATVSASLFAAFILLYAAQLALA